MMYSEAQKIDRAGASSADPGQRPAKVYVVEDEGLIALEIADRLEDMGYDVCGTSARGEDAVEGICRHRPDVVLMDIQLAGEMSGIDAAAQLAQCCDVPVLYLTAYSDDQLLREAARTACYGYILKPFKERELRANIEMAIGKHRYESRVRRDGVCCRAILENSSDCIQILDHDGGILAVNRAAVELLEAQSADGVIGESAFAWVPPDHRSALGDAVAAAQRREARSFELVVRASEGELRRLVAYAIPIPACRPPAGKSQVLLVAREKVGGASGPSLESFRDERMAASIARRIEDHLRFILGSAEMSRIELNPKAGDPVAAEIDGIVDAAAVASELLCDLLDMSGSPGNPTETFAARPWIEEALDEAGARMGVEMLIRRNFESNLPKVIGDRDQLRRAVVRLCGDAWAALPTGGALEMRLEKRQRAVGAAGEAFLAITLTGDSRIELKSNASSAIAFHAGDAAPCAGFTGMAIVRRIAEGHGGALNVENAGSGFKFTLLLPVESEVYGLTPFSCEDRC